MGEVKAMMRLAVPIEVYQIVQAVRLLLGNVLCSHVQGIAHHWRVTAEGCVPAGPFGRVVAPNRFKSILSNLHFANNNDQDAIRDRMWKVSLIVDALKQTLCGAWQ